MEVQELPLADAPDERGVRGDRPPGDVHQAGRDPDVEGVATCVADSGKNDQPCEDGNKWTRDDTCQGGTCQAGPMKTRDQCQVCAVVVALVVFLRVDG